MRIRAKLAAAAVLAVAVLMLIPGIASAHAERSVGPFDLGDRILRTNRPMPASRTRCSSIFRKEASRSPTSATLSR